MRPDPQAYADVLVQAIKSVMAPLQATVSGLQVQVVGWDAKWNDVGALRERVAVLEVHPAPVPPGPDETLQAYADVQATVGSLQLQVSGFDSKWNDVGALRERLAVVETKVATPAETSAADLARLEDNIRLSHSTQEVGLILATNEWAKKLAVLSERLAVVETRPLVPGPAGEPGPAGKDGTDGKDGTAGLSFEGVYQDGKSYELGHLVTWAGSSWHCNEPTTTKPGDGSKAWTLMVKRGRDGKDGGH